MADHCAEVTGTVSGHFVILRIPDERQHLGSPQLSFEVEADGEGAVLNGLFMPMPSVWTAFMALYGLIVFGGFCGAVYGYAQIQIDHPPTALWSLPLTFVLLILVYVAAGIGKHRGHQQIEELQLFVEQAVASEA